MSTPAHMDYTDEEDWGGFEERWYRETECQDCHGLIYQYDMDTVIEWKHAKSHSTYCHPGMRAHAHTDRCCLRCSYHVDPHVGCILR